MTRKKSPENLTAAAAGCERYALTQNYITRLGKHRYELTAQEYRTLKGQALAGDLAGAEKGLKKIIGFDRQA